MYFYRLVFEYKIKNVIYVENSLIRKKNIYSIYIINKKKKDLKKNIKIKHIVKNVVL